MRIFIPELKTELCLLQPWKFKIDHDGHNKDLWEAVRGHGPKCNGWSLTCNDNDDDDDTTTPTPAPTKRNTTVVLLPEGSHIIVDKLNVYTRAIKPGEESSSNVSLRLVKCPDTTILPVKKTSQKFWVDLSDMLGLDAEVVDPVIAVRKPPRCGGPVTVKETVRRLSVDGANSRFWIKGTIAKAAIDDIAEIRCYDRSNYYGYNYQWTPSHAGSIIAQPPPAAVKVFSLRLKNDWNHNFEVDNFDITTITGGTAAKVSGLTRSKESFTVEFFKIVK